jgi:hypothetical protein
MALCNPALSRDANGVVSLEEFGHFKERVPHGFREHIENDPSAGDPKHIDTIAATRDNIPQLAFWTEEGGMDDVTKSSLNLLSEGSDSEAHHDIAHDLDTQDGFLDTSKKALKKVTMMEEEMGYVRADMSKLTKGLEVVVEHLVKNGVVSDTLEMPVKEDPGEWYARRCRERMQKDVEEIMKKQKAAKKKAAKAKTRAAHQAAQQQDDELSANDAAAAAATASTININADEV